MKNEFVCVFKTDQAPEAWIIKGLLEDNGIEATVINKKDSQFLFGELEVHVKKEDSEKALQIITNREPIEGEDE